MKKILAVVLALVLCMALCAVGSAADKYKVGILACRYARLGCGRRL